MILFREISAKRYLMANVIVIVLTSLSYLSALVGGKGFLPWLFYMFRFPTHTLFWDSFNPSSGMYRTGLVINIFFWSIILERIFYLIQRLFKFQTVNINESLRQHKKIK